MYCKLSLLETICMKCQILWLVSKVICCSYCPWFDCSCNQFVIIKVTGQIWAFSHDIGQLVIVFKGLLLFVLSLVQFPMMWEFIWSIWCLLAYSPCTLWHLSARSTLFAFHSTIFRYINRQSNGFVQI